MKPILLIPRVVHGFDMSSVDRSGISPEFRPELYPPVRCDSGSDFHPDSLPSLHPSFCSPSVFKIDARGLPVHVAKPILLKVHSPNKVTLGAEKLEELRDKLLHKEFVGKKILDISSTP